jgi:hypothetical protein
MVNYTNIFEFQKGCFNLMEALDFNDQAAVHYAAKNGNTLVSNIIL